MTDEYSEWAQKIMIELLVRSKSFFGYKKVIYGRKFCKTTRSWHPHVFQNWYTIGLDNTLFFNYFN